MSQPNELPNPDDPGTGGGGFGRWRGDWPQEMPIDATRFVAISAILREVLALKAKVATLENAALTDQVMGRAFYNPAELPNPDDPNGGGFGGWHGDFPGDFPGDWPQEMPIEVISKFEERFAKLEATILERLDVIEKTIGALKARG